MMRCCCLSNNQHVHVIHVVFSAWRSIITFSVSTGFQCSHTLFWLKVVWRRTLGALNAPRCPTDDGNINNLFSGAIVADCRGGRWQTRTENNPNIGKWIKGMITAVLLPIKSPINHTISRTRGGHGFTIYDYLMSSVSVASCWLED